MIVQREHKLESIAVEQTIQVRNGKQGYIEHSPEEIAFIHSIQIKVDALNHFDLGVDFENIEGTPDWNLAIIPQKNLGNYKSVIVPIIEANEINAFYYVFDGIELTYNFVDKSLIRPPYFVYVGPINHIYEQIFHFYDHVLSETPFEDGTGYDDTFDDNPELGGCFITTTTEVGCSCIIPPHTLGEECNCSNTTNGIGPYLEYTATPVECPPDGGGGGVGPDDSGPGTGSGGSNGNNNNSNPKIHTALKYMWSVCPIISQEACAHLEFIIENVSNSNYCLNISMQVANLLENPSPANVSAANCFIMNTSVQTPPSSANSCSNPFSLEPLSDFAETYNEMNSSLISWTASYPGMDDIPCDLTVAGYTSDEKNQILQAFKDYLGFAPPIIHGEIPPPNPELDKVNALNAIISNSYYPELIGLIPDILGWDSFDNIPNISNFIKNYPAPISQDVKDMLKLAAEVSDQNFLDEVLDLLVEENDDEAVLATSMTFVTFNNSSIYGPYDTDYHTKINPYVEENIIDPTLMAVWAGYFTINCAVLRDQNPNWSDAKIYWHASKEMIHIALDLGGLIPGIGEIFDITNGVIYTIEGDGINAALSYSAAIPVVGWLATGGKYVLKGKWALKVKTDGSIDFGRKISKKFPKQLGLVKGDGKHAHHIIPWEFRDADIVQKTAKSDEAFHINEVLNGIPLPSSNHLTGHAAYNTKVQEILIDMNTGTIANHIAYDKLTDFISYLDDLISTSPNLNLGEIADLIDYIS